MTKKDRGTLPDWQLQAKCNSQLESQLRTIQKTWVGTTGEPQMGQQLQCSLGLMRSEDCKVMMHQCLLPDSDGCFVVR